MKDNPIVLYGAGEQNCGNAYDFLYSAGLGVEFICDKDTLLQDTQFLGISIKSPAILKEFDKKNQCWYLIITARESKTVLSIRKSINDLELKHARVLTFLEFLEQKQLQSKAKRIACINVHAVLSCNFNCARCCAFSPLAKTPGLLDTQGFENDLKRLSVLTEGNLLEFHIEGGEPTLHPRLSEITNMVGKYFPQTYIKIITNGLTIKTLSDLFWESCKINNVKIEVTKYPITLPYGDLLEFIRSKGIESVYGNTGNSETQKQFTNFTQLNIEGVNRGGGQ
ncbi:MAG: hypothetical protein Ta2B_17310 [Termitinemataceae bacterium]|nr:MAG: hypothetical protein Ta2B_17310 [Termitinemataceae bacterium]